MTREIIIPQETWTLVTIASCSFQASCNLQVAELDISPTDWNDPKKVILKTKIYDYTNTAGKGLWALSADDAIITIDDSCAISETGSGFIKSALNPGGGIDVNIQDQTSPTVIAKFNQVKIGTTLAAETAIDDRVIQVADSTGFQVGYYVVMYDTTIDRYYLGYITNIIGNNLTLDTPLDAVFPVGAIVGGSITNMNAVGSVSSPQIYGLRGASVANPLNLTFDITRIIIHCLTSSSVDLSKFGDIAGGLANGLIMRTRNGEYHNIFNVKTNGDIAGIMYDFSVQSATNPAQGQNGFYARLTFASPGKLGVAIRLSEGTDLELIVQDDLSSIDLLEVVAEGHVVE